MKNGRLFWNGVLLSLPAVMLVGAVAYFLVDKVPQLERNERKRVQQEYRERAIEAKEKGDGEEFDFEKSGLKKGAFKDRREPLGFERDFVWYFKEGKAYRVSVEPVEGFDFSAVFCPVGIGLMLLFVNFDRSTTVTDTLYVEGDKTTGLVSSLVVPEKRELEWRFWPFDD